MKPEELKREKAELRARMRADRNDIVESARRVLAPKIAERALETVKGKQVVMLYLSFGSEVPTDDLADRLHAAGHRLAVPWVSEGEIFPVEYRPGEPVAPGAFGIREPTELREVRPWDLDVMLAPGLAFDRTGARLGYGGGYFDGLMGRMRPDALRVGIAFSRQVIDRVPGGRHDELLDLIVTDLERIECHPELPEE